MIKLLRVCACACAVLLLVHQIGWGGGPTFVSAANPTSIAVNAPSKVNPGDSFSVTVSVTPGGQIAGLQLSLSFNPAVVDCISVVEGNLLTSGGNTTYFSPGIIGTGTITNIFGVITTPGGNVSTSGTFATVNFKAKSSGGACALTLSNVIVGDQYGSSLPVNLINTQVGINRAPTLNAIGNKSVNVGQLLQFVISGSDQDGDTLIYSASNLPSGSTFNASSRTFSWTPNYAQSGTYSNLTFTVSDGSLMSQQAVTIVVANPYPNWDVNADGKTNVLDMISVGQHFGEIGTLGWIPQDVNRDLTVNVLDMVLIGQHWTG